MKYRSSIYYFLLFLGVFASYGQENKKVDSLQQLILHQQGILKAKTLNELAWELRKEKDSTPIYYALEALEISTEHSYSLGASGSLNRLGDIAKHRKLVSDAENYYIKALKIDQEIGYKLGVARTNNQLGLMYRTEKKPVKALEYFLESLEIYEEEKKYTNATTVARTIGLLYEASYQDYKNSLKYHLKELEYAVFIKNRTRIAKAYKSLGALQKKQQNYEEALTYFQEAKKIYKDKNDYEEIVNTSIHIAAILDYLDKDVEAQRAYNDVWKLLNTYKVGDKGAFHHNIATFYKKVNQNDSALYHYQKGKIAFEKEKDYKKLSRSYNNIGNLHYKFNEYDEALDNLHSSLVLQQRLKDSSLLEKTYTSLARAYKAINEPEKAYAYKDSAYIMNKKEFVRIKAADRYEVAYVNEKRSASKAKNEQEIAEANTRQKNTIITGLLIALILSTLLFFYVSRSRNQKQQRVLAEERLQKQEVIALQERNDQEQKMQKILKSQEMHAINAMINGQEEERKRIAQDLHDKLGSMLSVVKIHYQSVEENMERIQANAKTQYVKANQLLDDACKAVREIAHDMVSGTLARFGLKPALEELKQTLEEASKLKINLVVHKLDDRLDNKKEIQIYRVIQELLNNIIKHAQATEVTIQLLKNKRGINMIVEDDGIGFDVSQTKDGMGLKTVASRVAEMKGTHFIDSGEGNGTIVTIDLPL